MQKVSYIRPNFAHRATSVSLLYKVQDELMELIIRRNLGGQVAQRFGAGSPHPIHEVEDDLRAELLELRRKARWTPQKNRPTFTSDRKVAEPYEAIEGASLSVQLSERRGTEPSVKIRSAIGGRRPVTFDNQAVRVTKTRKLRLGGLKITMSNGVSISLSVKQLMAVAARSPDSPWPANASLSYCCYDGCDLCK